MYEVQIFNASFNKWETVCKTDDFDKAMRCYAAAFDKGFARFVGN